MKKLIVIEEETRSPKAGIVAEFFSLQYNYGLYDFDPDKIIEDVENHYGVKKVSMHPPYYDLEDADGLPIKVMLTEDYVQYNTP